MSVARERAVIILGLDGVSLRDLEIVGGWGVAPNLSRILRRSYRNSPEVLIPYTAPSWTSVATGVNPGKHNVYDFLKPLPNGELYVTSPEDVMYPRVNEVLAMQGIPSITSNVPYAYPPTPRKMLAAVIPSWNDPKAKAWPPELASTIRRVGDSGPSRAMSISKHVEELVDKLEERLVAELEIAERYPWRLYFSVIPQTDWIFHSAYPQAMEGKLPEVKRLFGLIDRFLKSLIDVAEGEPMVVLVSDHGFDTVELSFNINVALMKAGLLVPQSEPLTLRGLFSIVLRNLSVKMPHLKHALKYPVMTLMQAMGIQIGLSKDQITRPIDYLKSAAFMITPYYIYINSSRLGGAQYREVQRFIEGMLSQTSKVLHFKYYRGEKIFRGPYTKNAPDYVVIPGNRHTFSVRLLSDRVLERGYWNIHASKGLVAVYVPGEKGGAVSELRELDVVSSVLYYLGLEIPHDTDGRVHDFLVEALGSKPRYRDYSRIYRRVKRLSSRLGRAPF